jgi:hypothetical protein
VIGSSLPDGIYDLITTASLLSDVAGNNLAANDTRTFHRLFGDADGNKVVNAWDDARFQSTYGRFAGDPLFDSAFDYDGNGAIDAMDLTQLLRRYGRSYRY